MVSDELDANEYTSVLVKEYFGAIVVSNWFIFTVFPILSDELLQTIVVSNRFIFYHFSYIVR